MLLAVESSCDETGIAIIDNKANILAEKVYSHINLHKKWGGVIPEVQARSHLLRLDELLTATLKEAGNLKINEVEAYSATCGPGLIGSLMCGAVYAKSIAWRFSKPFFAINHLEGHILSPALAFKVDPSYLLLLVSGGHTAIFAVKDFGSYQLIGETLDDALGEAFDKVGKLIGLEYPQGPALEELAKEGDSKRFDLPSPLVGSSNCNFSFSGLKSAAKRCFYISSGNPEGISKKFIKTESINTKNRSKTSDTAVKDGNLARDIAASFSVAACKCLVDRCQRAINITKAYNFKHFAVAGGVASNKLIRNSLEELALKNNLGFLAPPLDLCTDNAKMIAYTALQKWKKNPKGEGLNSPVKPVWRIE